MSCSCTPLASDFFWKTPTSCKGVMLCHQLVRICTAEEQKQVKQLLPIHKASQPEPCAGAQSIVY